MKNFLFLLLSEKKDEKSFENKDFGEALKMNLLKSLGTFSINTGRLHSAKRKLRF